MPTSVLDRFLRYVRYDTQSSETSTTYPSTPGQLVLLNDLADRAARHGRGRCGGRSSTAT